ncbi:uncharacterized protein FOMMEDRAFT_153988 [Fomitiporia mediterranea MF3/22]|uniref:uncharacterized protein n=1 Tax=Fomitiporia mediterranea (strain MF3/22) TaxID=694068 RepID=UPI0004408576|nr:uncharacterized protein FOMMEDRAFT_153988 [Fomitiporia mediterranea MF3/22]EJD04856.1 hypothetical protein FOMMEDRAFT_153988 [Fomitiporia mediterranea MF3/22]
MSIDSLPLETLIDIFHECILNISTREESISVPVGISAVCLWTYLDYCVDGRPQKWIVEIFDAWLHRSNGAPLNFSFKCHFEDNRSPEDNRAVGCVVSLLLSHQWHWGKLDFDWKFWTSHDFPGIELTNMLMLTSLRLHTLLEEHYETGSIDLTQSLKLGHLRLEISKISQGGPEFGGIPGCWWKSDDGYCPDVIMHNLWFLSLHGFDGRLVIDELLLPALGGLRYQDNGLGNGAGSLLKFVQRSLPPLKHLQMGGNCADGATLIRILPLLPLLQVLELYLCDISAQLFELLSIPNGVGAGPYACDTSNPIVCPDLRFFRFLQCTVVGDSHDCANALCTMLESRRNTLKLWKSMVGIDGPQYPDFAINRDTVERQLKDIKGSDFIIKCIGDAYHDLSVLET